MDAKEYIKLPPEEKLMTAIFGSYSIDTIKTVNGITLRQVTESVLSTLGTREERILRIRFGFANPDSEEGRAHTLEEVGKVFNVTRERIRQIENKALRRLRHWTRSRLLRPYLQVSEEKGDKT